MSPPRVCVFCGAGPGTRREFAEAAQEFGEALVAAGFGLVFGAGGVGIMGAVSDAVIKAGGDLVGVIPQSLMDREYGRTDIADLRVVGTMHERKALMHELSIGFAVLPGGLGTFEEFFEVLTWAQLGLHAKPIVVVDVSGYYAPLVGLLDHALESGFLTAADRRLVQVVPSVTAAIEILRASSARRGDGGLSPAAGSVRRPASAAAPAARSPARDRSGRRRSTRRRRPRCGRRPAERQQARHLGHRGLELALGVVGQPAQPAPQHEVVRGHHEVRRQLGPEVGPRPVAQPARDVAAEQPLVLLHATRSPGRAAPARTTSAGSGPAPPRPRPGSAAARAARPRRPRPRAVAGVAAAEPVADGDRAPARGAGRRRPPWTRRPGRTSSARRRRAPRCRPRSCARSRARRTARGPPAVSRSSDRRPHHRRITSSRPSELLHGTGYRSIGYFSTNQQEAVRRDAHARRGGRVRADGRRHRGGLRARRAGRRRGRGRRRAAPTPAVAG